MHVDCIQLSHSTLTVLYPAKYLTEREGVESQARQSHATAKAEHTVEGEGV